MKEGLYSGLDAEFYDELLEGELEDLPFWRMLLESNPGPALEVGCGTGRIMLPLIQEGHRIDGMDSSKRMVDLLLEKADQLNLTVDARVQVMEDLDMGKSYDLVFIPGFSLQMVESRELLKQSLKQFHNHLSPEGKLAVSLFFPWEELEEDEPGEWRLRKKIKRPDGTRLVCHQSTVINYEDQSLVVENRYTLLDNERNQLNEELRDIRLLWFYPHEFHLLLEECGFELLDTYSDFQDEPMDEQTPHAVFLARKS
jgi:SAM-dependent methyltransferase